jgi:hypothetical protein
MKIINEVNGSPIIDVCFEGLEMFDIESIFSAPPQRANYGTLHVNPGRHTLMEGSVEFSNMIAKLRNPIYNISERLFQMSKNDYPLINLSFRQWWDKTIIPTNRVGIQRVIDSPGFNQPWHLDNRFMIASGIVNMQDNDTSTHFSKRNEYWNNNGDTFDHCELVHVGRKEKFTGTFWLNTQDMWHCVPLIKSTRKILLFNLMFCQF